MNPVIPPEWDGFEIRYRFGGSVYYINVINPDHVSSHVHQILLDGQALKSGSIPLSDDDQDHQVVVTMGNEFTT